MKLRFYTLDVFAEEKYAGNQLAVFRAGDIPDALMQKIAREMNYSETTFIVREETRNGGYDVRIFTPEKEVPFAGHPTLGTAYVIQREIVREPVEKVILNLKVGRIPVTFEYSGAEVSRLWMKQNRPVFGRIFDALQVSLALNLDMGDLDDRFPIQEVSTGLPFIMVPLKNLDALKRAHVSRDRYFDLIRDTDAKAIFVFCPESHSGKNDSSARLFADYYGVPEDPATGSANGCLAGYAVKYRYWGEGRIEKRVEQGYEIGRPSLLYLRAEEIAGGIDVNVGGSVLMVAKGEFV